MLPLYRTTPSSMASTAATPKTVLPHGTGNDLLAGLPE